MDFPQHPGYYFVAATLVPLGSFLLIFLAKGVWGVLRPYRDNDSVAPIYNLFGGDVGGRGAAYLATAAIFASFVLSLIGFIEFTRDQSRFEAPIAALEKETYDLRQQAEK